MRKQHAQGGTQQKQDRTRLPDSPGLAHSFIHSFTHSYTHSLNKFQSLKGVPWKQLDRNSMGNRTETALTPLGWGQRTLGTQRDPQEMGGILIPLWLACPTPACTRPLYTEGAVYSSVCNSVQLLIWGLSCKRFYLGKNLHGTQFPPTLAERRGPQTLAHSHLFLCSPGFQHSSTVSSVKRGCSETATENRRGGAALTTELRYQSRGALSAGAKRSRPAAGCEGSTTQSIRLGWSASPVCAGRDASWTWDLQS